MAIGLLIERIDTEIIESYTPIASQEFFNNYWIPVSNRYGFQWIPLFATGANFNQKDLPYILDELKRFKELSSQEYSIDSKEYTHILTRIDSVIIILSNLIGKNVAFFIG